MIVVQVATDTHLHIALTSISKAILKALLLHFTKILRACFLQTIQLWSHKSNSQQFSHPMVHRNVQQHVQSSEQKLAIFSQATASTTWPFPLCRLILKWISSVGLGASYKTAI